jgi:hypothetical protein
VKKWIAKKISAELIPTNRQIFMASCNEMEKMQFFPEKLSSFFWLQHPARQKLVIEPP